MKSYDPKKEYKHIIHLDANKLYVYATSKFLLRIGFKLIDTKEFDLNTFSSNNSKGCDPEGDLEYPKEIRELHNDYPFAPDKREIKTEMLCNY